jgi:hypothetical protein
MHEEACRFHVQLLTDVFADLDQVGAALAALTGFWLMAVLDALQFRWQRLTAGSLAQSLGRRLGVKFLLDRGQVGVDRFLKQQALFATERFTGLAEAYPAVVGQFVRQRLDLEILLGQQGILPRQLDLLMPELGLLLLQLSLLIEAFAYQGLTVWRPWVHDEDPRVSLNGGAIAFGHSPGMLGARLVTTAVYQLQHTGGRFALHDL